MKFLKNIIDQFRPKNILEMAKNDKYKLMRNMLIFFGIIAAIGFMVFSFALGAISVVPAVIGAVLCLIPGLLMVGFFHKYINSFSNSVAKLGVFERNIDLNQDEYTIYDQTNKTIYEKIKQKQILRDACEDSPENSFIQFLKKDRSSDFTNESKINEENLNRILDQFKEENFEKILKEKKEQNSSLDIIKGEYHSKSDNKKVSNASEKFNKAVIKYTLKYLELAKKGKFDDDDFKKDQETGKSKFESFVTKSIENEKISRRFALLTVPVTGAALFGVTMLGVAGLGMSLTASVAIAGVLSVLIAGILQFTAYKIKSDTEKIPSSKLNETIIDGVGAGKNPYLIYY